MAARKVAELSDAPNAKECESIEVDVPAEIKSRPYLSNVGASLYPYQDMVKPFREELPEARSASPPFRPFCARAPRVFLAQPRLG